MPEYTSPCNAAPVSSEYGSFTLRAADSTSTIRTPIAGLSSTTINSASHDVLAFEQKMSRICFPPRTEGSLERASSSHIAPAVSHRINQETRFLGRDSGEGMLLGLKILQRHRQYGGAPANRTHACDPPIRQDRRRFVTSNLYGRHQYRECAMVPDGPLWGFVKSSNAQVMSPENMLY